MEFADFLKKRDIQHICTSVYHPAANGAIERFHHVLKSCIQSAIVSGKSWNPTVTQFFQAYRATPHSATGLSPFGLLCVRKMCTCLNIFPPPVTGKSVRKYHCHKRKWKHIWTLDEELVPLTSNREIGCVYRVQFMFQKDIQFFFFIIVFIFFFYLFVTHNYTEYNQQWNVSQVRSMESAIIWNTNTKNIHKY